MYTYMQLASYHNVVQQFLTLRTIRCCVDPPAHRLPSTPMVLGPDLLLVGGIQRSHAGERLKIRRLPDGVRKSGQTLFKQQKCHKSHTFCHVVLKCAHFATDTIHFRERQVPVYV